MVSYSDIYVKGSMENVQSLVQQAFVANGFSVAWSAATKGKAEKGSKGMNVAFGAFAQYYGVDFEIFPGKGATALRLHKSNTGWAGGYLGARKVEKQFQELSELLAQWFNAQGVLQGVRKD